LRARSRLPAQTWMRRGRAAAFLLPRSRTGRTGQPHARTHPPTYMRPHRRPHTHTQPPTPTHTRTHAPGHPHRGTHTSTYRSPPIRTRAHAVCVVGPGPPWWGGQVRRLVLVDRADVGGPTPREPKHRLQRRQRACAPDRTVSLPRLSFPLSLPLRVWMAHMRLRASHSLSLSYARTDRMA
jgi:hypothetical protein